MGVTGCGVEAKHLVWPGVTWWCWGFSPGSTAPTHRQHVRSLFLSPRPPHTVNTSTACSFLHGPTASTRPQPVDLLTRNPIASTRPQPEDRESDCLLVDMTQVGLRQATPGSRRCEDEDACREGQARESEHTYRERRGRTKRHTEYGAWRPDARVQRI